MLSAVQLVLVIDDISISSGKRDNVLNLLGESVYNSLSSAEVVLENDEKEIITQKKAGKFAVTKSVIFASNGTFTHYNLAYDPK